MTDPKEGPDTEGLIERHKEEAVKYILIVEDEGWPDEEIVKHGARKRAAFHTATADALQALQARVEELEVELELKSDLYDRSYNDLFGRHDENNATIAQLREALVKAALVLGGDAMHKNALIDALEAAHAALGCQPNPDTGATPNTGEGDG